jgi:glycine hydroxymethyltransferase
MNILGSVLTNKYSEGLPGKRYYGGNIIIDKIETLCQKRALDAFNLNENEWGVNVQPYSGSIANLIAYNALLEPNDRIMGLDLPSGGHLTHGFYTHKKKISATSVFYQSLPYYVNSEGYIDYDRLEQDATSFKPKLIICGYSAYSRDLDYKRFKKIADINNSYLLCDMAHYSGLVAAQECSNPFLYADIVTSTTHKTLAGPRAGMIFYKKRYEEQVNFSTFPAIQGGPHQHQIGALCFQLKYVNTKEFKNYIIQVKKNAKTMAEEFMNKGYKVCTNGTDNHLILIDLNPQKITGSKIEKICEYVDISINKNSVASDKSALSPCGIRLGTSALTSRGFKEEDFIKVVEFIDSVIEIALEIQKKSGPKLVDFIKAIEINEVLINIKKNINIFANTFEFYD